MKPKLWQGGKMCDLCSEDKSIRKNAIIALQRQQDRLEEMKHLISKLETGRIKPHSEEFSKKCELLVKSILRFLTGEYL